MVKRILYIFTLFLLCQTTFAQKPKHVADSLKTALSSATTDTTRVSLMNEIAYEYVAEDSLTTYKYAREAQVLAEKIGYKRGLMNSSNVLGLLAYYNGHYDEAMRYHEATRKLAEEIGDKKRLGTVLNNIGLVYDDKGEYDKALKYYLESFKMLDQLGKEGLWQKGNTLNNIALIYQLQEKYDDALKCHLQALEIKREVNNKKGIGSSYHNLGLVYKLKKDYAKSLEYYEKAMKVREEVGDLNGLALTLNNIGSNYEEQSQFDVAFTYFERSLKVREQLNDRYGLVISMLSMGSNQCMRGHYDKGFEYFNKALNIAKESGSRDLIRRAYEFMAHASAKQKDWEKAFEYQTLFMQMKDSIFNAESNKQMNEMQAKYDSEKKQREIELLTKDTEIKELQLNKNRLWMIVVVAAGLLCLLLAGLLYNRYKLKQKANDLLEDQNHEITQQKKEITDSINYAKRIQESILPPEDHWKKLLPQSFIFYRPKDIVSGDFYWIEQKNDVICFAAVDCTGHGVPGALMSVVGFNLLTQAVNEMGLTKPSDILKHLDAGVTKTLRQSEAGKGVKDGMDLALCSLNIKTGELQYAGAFNSLYYISGGQFNEIKADKFPIGINLDGKVDEYRNHTVQLSKGDSLYLFSDGYADQFGGPQGKKFKYRKLKELLTAISGDDIDQQKKFIEKTFDDWKGSLEQIDDVVIIGVKI